VPVVNHVRVPVLGAGLTFLLFLPGILGRGDATLQAVSGLDTAPVAGRWLLLVAAMAGTSALVYLVRVLRARPTSAHGGQ
jgi:Flp pilus assembly protein protease CpaA